MMITEKKHKREIILLFIVIFEILLLINLTPAHSYLIHQTDPSIKNVKVEKSEFGELINDGMNLLIGFLSIKQIGIVSAQESLGCCLDNCQNVEKEECVSGNYLPSLCSATSQCQEGTCVDKENGVCSAGAPKYLCEINEGIWNLKPIDQVSDCKLGCCILDDGDKKFTRRIQCEEGSGTFDSSIPQEECKVYTEEMGACVLGGGDCQFVSEKICEINLNGNFYVKNLCSNPELGTNCEMPSKNELKTSCYNNQVHFLDTCGNLANVYDSSKINDENYWKSVQEPSCNIDLSNKNSIEECGTCDGLTNICDASSKAGVNPDYGNYACKDLSCIDELDGNKKRQNQESWCVYESYTGNGKDVVGSEHRMRWCDQGEIKFYEPCDNTFRSRICAEKVVDGISTARCRFNEGFKGLSLESVPYEFDEDEGHITNQNEVDNYKDECESLSDSRIQSVDVYEPEASIRKNTFFKFDYCVSEYPPGLKFWDINSNAGDMCEIASTECTVYITKRRCKRNCNCLSQEWANQMNDFCISLGDCGGYVNVEGTYTKSFSTFDVNSLGKKFTKRTKENEDSNGDISTNKKSEYKTYAVDSKIGQGDLPEFFSSTEQGYWGGEPPDISYFGKRIINVFHILTGIFSTASGVAAAVGGPVGIALSAIFALVALFLEIFGAEPKEITIEFKCMPWQAPVGGDDCEKCNDDPLRPCTEYKCKSLGTACALVSEGELYEAENPLCINRYPNDFTPPKIVFEDIDNEKNYQITNTDKGLKIRTSDGGCIREFSDLNLTLKTENENGEEDYAKCVYNRGSVSPPGPANDYSLIGDYFTELTFFSITHNFETKLPFVSSLSLISGDFGEREGEFNMYIRCMDYAGNSNHNEYLINFCVKEGPDVEPAIIKEYSPKDKSSFKYGETEQNLKIYLNEPAECRWSNTANMLYDDMKNEMDCEDYLGYPCQDANTACEGGTCADCTGDDCECEDDEDCGTCIEQSTSQSRWWCATRLTGLTLPENKIYIKCEDQPWISEDDYDGPWSEVNRNVNEKDFVYTLYSTPSELKIDSVSPLGEVRTGGDTSEVELKIETSGGVDNGVSTCRYKFLESPTDIDAEDFFFITNSKTHKQYFDLARGNYNLLITCTDEVGNKAIKNAIFNVLEDHNAPVITRAYKDGGSLKLITDEKAKCYYNFNKCYFNLYDNSTITDDFSTVHTIFWKPGSVYYIKCEDEFGNIDSGCTKKIIPSS